MEARLEGSELQRLMEDDGLTQRELAERARVDDSVISLARRRKQPMSVESERKVAEALGVGVEELVDGDGRGAYRADSNSVRLVAGQREEVAYPETEDRTGEESASLGGDRSDLVSLIGLKNRRIFKCLNQSELARRTGLNRGTINQAERKGRATRRTARLVAGALGVRVEELAKVEQRSRFPERQTTTVTYPERRTISPATDSSPATDEKESSPLTVELSEPVLRRVDRFLDLLESALRPRRA